MIFPIKKLGEVCRKYNVLSVVDGAHGPGQLDLQVESYGVDVYIGKETVLPKLFCISRLRLQFSSLDILE